MADIKRVFIIVLDSVGIGELPDAADFGDVGSHTVKACFNTGKLNVPNMQKLGLLPVNNTVDKLTAAHKKANALSTLAILPVLQWK